MTWVRIDDHFDEHPKLAQAGTVCWGVWLAGIAYCNRNLTDGFIPWSVARSLGSWEMLELEPDADDPERRTRVWTVARASGMAGDDMETGWIIERLVGVGLWEQVNGGFRIHDYHDFQPSREDVLTERKRNADRQRKHRESRNAGSNGESNGATNGGVTPAPYPVPGPVPVPNVLSDVLGNGNAREQFIEPAELYATRARRKSLSQKERDWIEDLHARFSRPEVVRALLAVNPGPDYLKRVDAYLEAA